jgi:hypothetical protein
MRPWASSRYFTKDCNIITITDLILVVIELLRRDINRLVEIVQEVLELIEL